MDTLSIFGMQFLVSVAVFALIARWFALPWLADKPFEFALTLLILPHAFRHIGLTFLVPSVTAGPAPTDFATLAAYGDFISALLAIASLVALRSGWRFAIPLVWVFNTFGVVDLVNALRHAEAVPLLGGMWFVPTFVVPLLLVTHALIFVQLFSHAKRTRAAGRGATQSA